MLCGDVSRPVAIEGGVEDLRESGVSATISRCQHHRMRVRAVMSSNCRLLYEKLRTAHLWVKSTVLWPSSSASRLSFHQAPFLAVYG